MTKKFQRKKEDFICQVCNHLVKGSGYTNHCPFCLFSKHVDINPGDRQEQCRGLMKPIGIIKKKGKNKIIFRCQKCHLTRLNRPAKNDNKALIEDLYRKITQDT